jgi:hypothetical protein
LKQRLPDRASCVYCMYETHDRIALAEHLREHEEIREYESWHSRATQDWQTMMVRRQQVVEQISKLRQT